MIRWLYKQVLKPILFKFDPEGVHDAFVELGEFCGRTVLGRSLISKLYGYKGEPFAKVVDGITYTSPVILAAGFDYNGRLTAILPSLSFGGVEIGSVTARPCPGNAKPRMKRLIRSHSLLVNKGLRNDGVEKLIERMKKVKRRNDFVIGISIAKTNDAQTTTLESGIEDYAYSFQRLNQENIGDYYTINISCPNVFGGENFAHPQRLRLLLNRLSSIPCKKPVYIKMPINLPWQEFDQLLKVIGDYAIQGVVIGNLNKYYKDADFQDELPAKFSGGLSGKPCRALSTELIRRTRESYGSRFTIIGCGGILSADDAKEKLKAGADLLQLITGMMFEGPHLMQEICHMYEKHPMFLKKQHFELIPESRSE